MSEEQVARAARDQFSELLPIVERVLGVSHPDTLATRYNAAVSTGKAADAPRARDLLAELVPVCERALGIEHPETLAAREALAYWAGLVSEGRSP